LPPASVLKPQTAEFFPGTATSCGGRGLNRSSLIAPSALVRKRLFFSMFRTTAGLRPGPF
jgi:hypothetical protein